LPLCRSSLLRLFHSFPTRRSSDLPVPWVFLVSTFSLRNQQRAGSRFEELVASRSTGWSRWPPVITKFLAPNLPSSRAATSMPARSEEHTSELQSRGHLVCRLLLEK